MNAQQIARAIGARLSGNSNLEIEHVTSAALADGHALVFVEDAKWLPEALESKAGAIIAGDFASASATPKTLLISDQPRLAFARASKLLEPPSLTKAGIHSSAVVHPSAKLGDQVVVGPHAVIEEEASIGPRTRIGAGSVIGPGVVIQEDCEIKSRVTIYPGTRVGQRAVIHAGAVLGSDGFGYVRDRTTGKYEQFPQIGTLTIGSDVEIGANSTVDRGALEETVIADGVKIDNLVHVGHNVRIGKNVVIAAQTGISGSVVIEDDVIIAGQVGIADHVHVEAGAILGAQCGIPTSKTIRGKGILFWGTPARPIKEYLRELATLSRLAKKGGR
jgi:UDP-3-O-[3-hydroxymyristoyl] glucosamine N-acyltransferase